MIHDAEEDPATHIDRGPSGHTLADNVIVKWEEYREWTDVATQESWYAWELRVCVVPKKLENVVRGMTPDPTRSFLRLDDLPQGAQMFPYQTFRYQERLR